jgi:hypothetical protein
VRELILSKLSLRELAFTAPTCREFRAALPSRLAEEREALVSAGEETYGKEMFHGFVRAIQVCMRNADGYPGLLIGCNNCLVINATGACELVDETEAYRRRYADARANGIHRMCATQPVCAHLFRKFPGEGRHPAKFAYILVRVFRSHNQQVHVQAAFNKVAAAAAMGLVLALCAGSHKTSPAWLGSQVDAVTLKFEGIWAIAQREEAEDLVGPLRSLAESFTCLKLLPPPHCLPSFEGRELREDCPLGHLRVEWCGWKL